MASYAEESVRAALPSTAGDDVLVSPFVSWVHLVLAFEPVRHPTEARLKTLRTRGACPAGVKVHLRSATGAAGSRHWYSSLGVWSAILLRSDREREAFDLTERANGLRSLLSAIEWTQVSRTEPDSDLVRFAVVTQRLADDATQALKLRTTPATWACIRGDKAVLEMADGSEIVLPLDSPHLVQSRLGDPLVVVREEAPNGTEIRLILPGLRRSTPAPGCASGEDDGTLAPGDGGLRGSLIDTPENRDFFRSLAATSSTGG